MSFSLISSALCKSSAQFFIRSFVLRIIDYCCLVFYYYFIIGFKQAPHQPFERTKKKGGSKYKTKMFSKPAVVMDNGTGYSKIGYSWCTEPNFVFPTCVAEPPLQNQRDTLDDLDFYIGNEAADMVAYAPQKYQSYNPIKHGIVENWDQMEKLWQQSIYKYLRAEPEEHAFILTESPFNPPENREYTAEIMFETFGVGGLHIAIQAVLSLIASTYAPRKGGKPSTGSLTGTVIDSGDGVTHVIPVCEGYVIQSGIKHINLAGKDITKFIFDMIKEREITNPEVNMMMEAQKIKEELSSVCSNLPKEFAKYDANPEKYIRKWDGTVPKTKTTWEIDVGPEQFLGPELFFHPEIFSLEHTTPLPQLIDGTSFFLSFLKRIKKLNKTNTTKHQQI